jgi:hypothetical protein
MEIAGRRNMRARPARPRPVRQSARAILALVMTRRLYTTSCVNAQIKLIKEGKERVGVMSAMSGIFRHLPSAHQGSAKLFTQRRPHGSG